MCWKVHCNGKHLPIERHVDLMTNMEQGRLLKLAYFIAWNVALCEALLNNVTSTCNFWAH
jgi:hypothetical protein